MAQALISKSNLHPQILKNEVAVVTGGGRGIGYEASRALIWMGARVVVAEIDDASGKSAVERLRQESGDEKAIFVKTDVGKEEDVEGLARAAVGKWGKVDAVLNNATVFPMGEVKDTLIEKWDLSYRVNLRGPVLLAQTFLPGMIERKHGVFVSVSSSGAAPFMGPYEVFKTAQGELASTIAGEVEGTGVYAFTIGPGIVRTPGFEEGGAQVAAFMGKTLDELLEMNKNFEISPEAAGVGFAASIALASKYHGQETSSIQVLREIGVVLGGAAPGESSAEVQVAPVPDRNSHSLFESVMNTYAEQSAGWKKRSLFERQWVARDFKKNTGKSIDEMTSALRNVEKDLDGPNHSMDSVETLKKLAAYYAHQQEQLKGFEKDPDKLKRNVAFIDGWLSDLRLLTEALTG
ncbi:MAG TPA: SDR family oxidoreductase [Nitrososphaerales archaeon]|nr:SDR family oxidoreductase [Nitrososphaerales archaeon]